LFSTQARYFMRGAQAHINAAAYHEAGHALAAMKEGVGLKFAYISRRLPGAGCVRLRKRHSVRNPFIPSAGAGAARSAWEISLQSRMSLIRLYLAGPLAEARYLGQPLRSLGAENDLLKCQHIANTLAGLHQQLDAHYADLPPFRPYERLSEERQRVRRWLGRTQTWQTITAIAEALVERETLSERELLQIYLASRARGGAICAAAGPGPKPSKV
jgi:hypothetical protein